MKVVLLCNYPPDGQQSMLRFGELLAGALRARGVAVQVIAPEARLAALFPKISATRAGRWLGYVDKYLLFPRRLRRVLRGLANDRDTVAHVIDHSNSVYVPARGPLPWVATCHDLLAVRGALGEDTDCPASPLGRKLQRRIVAGLGRADGIASVSHCTRDDLDRLVPAAKTQLRAVIPLALNQAHQPTDRAVGSFVAGMPASQAFILHVGSNLARKNKAGVLRVFLHLAQRGWPGHLVFCGAELPEELRADIEGAGLTDRVHALPRASEEQLNALYSRAHALVFPSRGEGFGWPIIEAQACDCPVVCSDRTSLPEVGGDAALVHALDDEAGMAASVLKLHDAEFRAGVVRRGRENLRRFSLDKMIDGYLSLYTSVLHSRTTQS